MNFRIGIPILSIAICFCSCNSSSSWKTQPESKIVLPERIKAVDQLPANLSKDADVVEYISEYEKTLGEFYQQAMEDKLNGSIVRGLWHAISNAWPLLSLEQQRISFNENYSESKWNAIRAEEDKITKVIHFAYYMLNEHKAWNEHRFNFSNFILRHADDEESLNDHLEALKEASVALDVTGAEYRYRLMNAYIYQKTNTSSDFSQDFLAASQDDFNALDAYPSSSIERLYLTKLKTLRTEINNRDFAYFQLKDDWSASKKEAYDSCFHALNGIIATHHQFLSMELDEIEPVDFFELQKNKSNKK
jgi:hypothetical protein